MLSEEIIDVLLTIVSFWLAILSLFYLKQLVGIVETKSL